MYNDIKTVLIVEDMNFHVGYMIKIKNMPVVCDSAQKAKQLLDDPSKIEQLIINLNKEEEPEE